MRLLLASSIAFLAGGAVVYSAVEGLPISNDRAAVVAPEHESGAVSGVELAEAVSTGAAEATEKPATPTTMPESEPVAAQPLDEGGGAADPAGDQPATLNSFAPVDRPAVKLPPLGLPDPDEAQAALPDEQKIALEPPPREAPELGTVRWVPASLYCGFVETDLPEPVELASADGAGEVVADEPAADAANVEKEAVAVEKKAPEDLLFVTERHYDGRAAVERAYMRIGGLMRELALKSVEEKDDGELRHYATFGGAPIDVRLDMQRIITDADRKLKAWHKPDRLLYRGAMAVGRGDTMRQVGFVGSCG
ncbi:hypothetical protein B7H23_05850 [Notoacmeibacter marinus]|uniref:Uncharacterized protein n=1 Tax=Notoacmeibacter marinus TaxID=1876515 RepID=A0A231V2P5_9HYPH|nr:hypothetical protein [Notoacmeibacter marinus]OXT02420.1 hypothetical protein B7H23_05850 [Notoacmeibacter marinus]